MHLADNLGPDQCAHLCSLIWAFSVCWHTKVVTDPQADNEGLDQPELIAQADQGLCYQ